MPSQWSIKIIDLGGGKIAFQPDLPGPPPLNQPLGANKNDLVTWNNTTNQTLTLKSINPPNTFLTDPIPPGKVSDPMFQVAASVTYSCVNPAVPQHSIVVQSSAPATS
jgi:hypothetical protein